VSGTIGQLRIQPMSQEDAEAVAGWHYDPPYDFYDADADHRDLEELLDAEKRGDRYFAARDASGELVGYFGFGFDDGVAGIGVGLRPDLTGRGLGLSFLEQGLVFATERYAPTRFRLYVAAFNRRAIKVYERAGFAVTRTLDRETNGGVFRFVEMEREA
jgi:[ribosomal protein S18]-alanine N-acetyltransferase